MAENNLLILSNKDFCAAVSPAAGASLAYFKKLNCEDGDIMRPASEKALNDAEASGFSMYPMLPYIGAIHGGSFIYYGIKRSVPLNVTGKKEPLDGDGWRFAWNVKESSATKVVLSCTGDPKKGFPFPYESEVTYSLEGNKLSVHIQVRNVGILPMPCALGVHPFFPKTKDTIVKFTSKNVWEHNETPVRDKPYSVTEDWSFKDGKKVYGTGFNTCFGGFDGKAEITWPSKGLKLIINSWEEFNHVILSVPNNKSFFCLEPVTSAIDVFNLASRGIMGAGMKSIGPNEEMTATVEFTVENI
jgi:aldose 1-epimerase